MFYKESALSEWVSDKLQGGKGYTGGEGKRVNGPMQQEAGNGRGEKTCEGGRTKPSAYV